MTHQQRGRANVRNRLLVSLRPLVTAAALLVIGCTSALAWKPKTHLYAAHQAIGPVMAGNDYVNIGGVGYDINPEVANAIRNYKTYYLAGVIGPDAYPDIYVGQAFIHPDTRCDNGVAGTCHAAGSGHSFSWEWLQHVYEAGWTFYNNEKNSRPGAAQQVLAFTYGFLTHAAGDMWGHTFVNDFARGVFPSVTDLPRLPIAARHIIVESYIGKYTPISQADLVIANNSDVLSEFIFWALMADQDNGGFVDSRGFDAAELGRGGIFDFFFGLWSDLRWASDQVSDLIVDPTTLLTFGPIVLIIDEWADDVSDGLHAWPYMSQQIAYNLFVLDDFSAAGSVAGDFVTDHITYMIGVPDGLALVIDIMSEILSLFGDLIEPLADGAAAFRNWMILQTTGLDVDAMRDYVIHPENHINSPLVDLDANTSATLDELMGRDSNSNNPFSLSQFKAMRNTVTMSSLVLMNGESLNDMLYDKRVGSIYGNGDNAMLEFIRTLDGHYQWRKTAPVGYENAPAGTAFGEGMPIWTDTVARDRVFRSLFGDWQNTNWPAFGETPELISNTPAPGKTLTISQPHVVNGGLTYVSSQTTYQVDGVTSYFWELNEITARAKVNPGSLYQGTGSVAFGPITGSDGAVNIAYNAAGQCIDGEVAADGLVRFLYLDNTPPEITVTVPSVNQVFDVNNTANLAYTAVDAAVGVDTTSATLDGAAIANGGLIDAFLLNAGPHSIVVTATDLLGNTGTLTVVFEVHATIAGLKAAVTRAYNEGLITKPKTMTALQSMLDNAQKALNKGNVGSAKNHLEGAANLVAGQLGSGVDTTFGNRFIGWVMDLVSRL